MPSSATKSYEAPRLDVVGSVHELTLDHVWYHCNPVFPKQRGNPDIWNFIPIAWCPTNDGSV